MREGKYNGKFKVLLIACVMILLCAIMIVGGTYALWSDSASVHNHLIAGKLDLTLERTSLKKTYLDNASGYMVTSTSNTPVDFSGSTTENVFGIGTNEKVVPTSEYEATLKITNNGDVAFSYDIIITLTTQSNALANQLKVYVDGAEKGMLSQYINGGQAIIATQAMTKQQTKTFTVKIEFINDNSINNAAQSQEVQFDMLVNAVQLTQAPQTQS